VDATRTRARVSAVNTFRRVVAREKPYLHGTVRTRPSDASDEYSSFERMSVASFKAATRNVTTRPVSRPATRAHS
jgi:hypothetical protein